MLLPILLTRREQEVLNLVVDGKRNKEIANELCVSENTIEQHLRNIYRKLKVTNRVQAVNLYMQLKFTSKNNGNPLLNCK